MAKLFIEDLDLKGKRVIMRVDFNVPIKDGKVENDKRLRASFRTDPVAIARELKIRPPEIALFVAMNPDQLDAQADILVQKRFHEVGKWLPLTFNALGEQAGIEFIAYSATFWPESHRRHLLDAARFARRAGSSKVSAAA